MIIWINGTYGVGKTTVALEIREKLLDKEIEILDSDFYYIEMIRENYDLAFGGVLPQTNENFIKRFKNLIEEKSENENVIVTMSLTHRECKEAIFDCLVNAGSNVLHTILIANEETIKSRIEHDVARDKEFALYYLHSNILFLNKNFIDATRINTEDRTASDIANEIVKLINSRLVE